MGLAPCSQHRTSPGVAAASLAIEPHLSTRRRPVPHGGETDPKIAGPTCGRTVQPYTGACRKRHLLHALDAPAQWSTAIASPVIVRGSGSPPGIVRPIRTGVTSG